MYFSHRDLNSLLNQVIPWIMNLIFGRVNLVCGLSSRRSESALISAENAEIL